MLFKIRNASYVYPNKALAFEKVHFSIEKNEVLCICGANGSGKSSLLRVMAGIFELTKGEIEASKSLLELSSLLFQVPDMQLLGQYVHEEIFLNNANPSEKEREKAFNLLKSFDLLECMDKEIDSLSFGQKRKLCLALCLMQEPLLLLLDEPTSGLDYPAQKQLREMLLNLKKDTQKGMSLCIVCHDIEFFADFVDKVIFLEEGEQIFYGNVEEAFCFLEENPHIGVKLPSYWKKEKKILPWND